MTLADFLARHDEQAHVHADNELLLWLELHPPAILYTGAPPARPDLPEVVRGQQTDRALHIIRDCVVCRSRLEVFSSRNG